MARFEDYAFDFFLSHAGEDKSTVAAPLAKELESLGLRVWFDKAQLLPGDRLSRRINEGLRDTHCGIVVLSPDFLRKEWPLRELDALLSREEDGMRIIPVLHSISRETIKKKHPLIAPLLSLDTQQGVQKIAASLVEVAERTWSFRSTPKRALGTKPNWFAKIIPIRRAEPKPSEALSTAAASTEPDGAEFFRVSEIACFEGHEESVHSVLFSPDDQLIASGSKDHTARIWDIRNRTEVGRITHDDQVRCVVFSSDGRRLATTGDDNTTRLSSVSGWRQLKRLKGEHRIPYIFSMAYSPDDQWIVTGGADGRLELWNTEKALMLPLQDDIADQVLSLAFSPMGRSVAAASRDGTVRLHNIDAPARVTDLKSDGEAVLSVSFSPDGRQLATGSMDGAVRLWDIASGRLIARHEGYADIVMSVDFSPDGQLLAAGGAVGTAFLWHIKDEREVGRWRAHEGQVRSVAFSHSDKRLVTGGDDRCVRLWQLDAGTYLGETARSETDHV